VTGVGFSKFSGTMILGQNKKRRREERRALNVEILTWMRTKAAISFMNESHQYLQVNQFPFPFWIWYFSTRCVKRSLSLQRLISNGKLFDISLVSPYRT
jgi:hypothetical protein